jgi:dihydroorotate dehydrogenase
MLYSLARSALFKLDPEVAHDLALKSLAALGPGAALLGAGADGGESRRVMGIDFPNPVSGRGPGQERRVPGCAAALGFGCRDRHDDAPPQPGNPKPRMFRLVEPNDHQPPGFSNVGVERLLLWH